jgi:hypothetical protein
VISLPASFVGDVQTAVGTNITALAPVLVALAALVVGFWVVKRVLGLFPKTR